MLAHLGIIACHSLQWVELCCLTLRTPHVPLVSNRLHSKCVIHRCHMLAVTPMYVRHLCQALAVTIKCILYHHHVSDVIPKCVARLCPSSVHDIHTVHVAHSTGEHG